MGPEKVALGLAFEHTRKVAGLTLVPQGTKVRHRTFDGRAVTLGTGYNGRPDWLFRPLPFFFRPLGIRFLNL